MKSTHAPRLRRPAPAVRFGRFAGSMLCFVAALAATAALAAEPEAKSASTLYRKYCASCHGTDGKGNTPLAKLFKSSPPDLTKIAERRKGWFPEVLIRETIDGRFVAHGGREMPVWGDILSQDDLTLITEYLEELQAKTKGE